MNALLVFIGGGLGALMRFGVSWLIQKFPITQFPLATLISNLVACLFVGLFIGMTMKMKVANTESFQAFWIIGICGGFSTFSTFAKENLELMERGNYFILMLNIVISILFGIVMVYLGRKFFV